ncbi:hypothetical protein GGR56DRAFT_471045 [Xylariaceae sp. FL0804]|nr:hypothetical protein GGR56DRAFT_471045 [Xylariaceae sp. FL0804]
MPRDHRHRGPPRRHHDDPQYSSGEEDSRSRPIPHHPRPDMASTAVTLPSMQDPHGGYGASGGRHWDPRASGYDQSPTSTNGYSTSGYSSSAPSAGYSPSGSAYSLPPSSAHSQHAPPGHTAGYGADMRAHQQYYSTQPPGHFGGAASYDYAYRPDRAPPGAYPPEYLGGGPPGAASVQQSAPRQRTSIACKYCRRRKVRLDISARFAPRHGLRPDIGIDSL